MDATPPQWAPEHEVGPELARRLAAGRWPEFRDAPMEPLAAGWDNTVFTARGTWVFRFPRRSIAVPLAEREIAALPVLAPRLPLPVPVPEYVAEGGSPEYPWPFWGARLVPGRELAESGLPEAGRERAAAGAGRFLRALHDPALLAEPDLPALPRDPMRRGDAASRAGRARAELDELARAGLWEPDPAAAALLERAHGAPPLGATAVCHGDLHVRHLLVDGEGAAAGVIDWGDLCAADPAIDLSLAYGGFSGTSRAAFLAAYGRSPSPEQELAARVLALFVSAVLARYAAAEGNGPLLAESLAGIGRATAP
ncbi:phosphotransferase [Spirillospora sp. NPDC029432]|uniref:phosphotransferase n=1 Tax=Spirillospora sp. NPDC029432 TaxID=3154599 RepID=UPI003454FD7E